MKPFIRSLLLLGGLPVWGVGSQFDSVGELGPLVVETQRGEWGNRELNDREVPWKLFLPKASTTPAPVVIFSPGGGGSRDDASGYLGAHLASHGFASLHLQHRGSDVNAIRAAGPAAMMRSIRESKPSLAVLRQQDIGFAVDEVQRMARSELRGRIDPSRLGIAGFSFGAVTTLIAAGQKVPAYDQSLAEPRFRAAFALSPSPRHGIAAPVMASSEALEAYSAMLMPIFHLTGTKDGTPATGTTPEHRQMPFRSIHNVDQYLLVLNGAVHPTFGGSDVDYDADRHRELIKMAAVVFWRAYLLEDAEALAWLQGQGYATHVGSDGSFEFKKGNRESQ